KGFSAIGRPKAIASWIKYARKGSPSIGKVDVFATVWELWWKGINPAWRLADGVLVKETKGSWKAMEMPGANGFLSVLVALKWWREAEKDATARWSSAIEDVTWV
ncbi:hypothetical protein B0H11DRAFT_1653640, partial [Mycena galericulata]